MLNRWLASLSIPCQSGCKSCRSAFVKRNNKKGGLEAGWGSADNWFGGTLPGEDATRQPDMVNPIEQKGAQMTYQVISSREDSASALSYKELYSEMVQKAEADLALESLPVGYRDYLRRYFLSIRPPDESPDSDQ